MTKISYGNPKSREAKGKGIATSSGTPYPWPRPANRRFTLPDSSLPLNSDEAWDQNDAYYYNNWIGIDVEPTRFLCPTTLMSLGIHREVTDIFSRAQLLELASCNDVLYPDLVRQCLASAKLTFANPKQPVASQGTLSFFANGKKHSVTIRTLCRIYGFDVGSEAVSLPTAFAAKNAFWNYIAQGPYASRSSSQASIRNPAIRIAAKALSTIFFAQELHSKVRIQELVLLYNGVREALSTVPDLACKVDLDVNMGAVFARVIADKRTTDGKTERIGSLLTKLFEHVGVDLGDTPCKKEELVMDTDFLIQCHIMVDSNIYRFTGRDDRVLFCRLPQPSLTNLRDGENIGFTPGNAYLCTEAGAPVPPENTRAGAAAPGTPVFLSDDEIEDLEIDTASVKKSKAHMRRPYRSEYILRDLPDDPSDREYRAWMVDSTKKNNGLMRRILHMLQKGCTGSKATATTPSTSAVPPPASRAPAPASAVPSSSGRVTRSSKRKKPLTDDDDSEHTTSA